MSERNHPHLSESSPTSSSSSPPAPGPASSPPAESPAESSAESPTGSPAESPARRPSRAARWAGAWGDARSGFLVFLIALPLCLGIALASGFPPVAGIITAIVGGVLVSLLGSAPLTIKGPAAGLIVIALGAVHELGGDDLYAGYRRALAVGTVAAVLQIAFALLRTASVGVAMSPSVVHGMLAAIGVIIISKQIHVVLGVKPEGEAPLRLIAEIPQSLRQANPRILLLGALALLVMFVLPAIRARWARAVPVPLVALAVTVPLGLWFGLAIPHDYSFGSATYHLGPEHLVRLPGTLPDALAFPDFSVIATPASLKYVLMFALIGTIESTLTVLAVDAMAPRTRPADLNRDLLALGGGNLVSSLLGGLPMISEIVRSKANVDAGAASARSNFFHGAFLLLFVALAPALLQTIPLAVLAAMLVYTGARLASPRQLIHARRIGPDQLALFATTLVVTLATDLLIGVAAGLVLKIALHLLRGAGLPAFLRPRAESTRTGHVLHVRIPRAAIFTVLLPLRRAISTNTRNGDGAHGGSGDGTSVVTGGGAHAGAGGDGPPGGNGNGDGSGQDTSHGHDASRGNGVSRSDAVSRGEGGQITEVVIDVKDAAMVDHTFLAGVVAMSQEWPATTVTVTGLDELHPVSAHPHATRLRKLRRRARVTR